MSLALSEDRQIGQLAPEILRWDPPVDDSVDRRALDDFVGRYGRVTLAPVVVLIPAFQEEGSIGSVIAGVPETMAGMAVDVVVVTDGCTDETAPIARRAGAFVCEARVNRGQGATYRLGYRLVAALGARYVITLDADGQYDPRDAERLLAAVVSGRADLAQGSRVMGRAEKDDAFRSAGVRVFGLVVSVLLGQRVTDSSNGLRAMRIDVPRTVRLAEDQYQSSEMLIGAVRCGFRYAELPVTVRKRTAGESKKAHNVLYGLHYLRVILTARYRRGYRNAGSRAVLHTVASTKGVTPAPHQLPV